ncbi:MAG: hypothetical protein J5654_00285 [Victivallales bacterium]|nr:hypothetical protein [Victivallales bacterium]
MFSSFLIFADAVDSFLDWLVPVVFFGVFVLSVISSAIKKNKEAERRRRYSPQSVPRPARNASAPRQYPRANGADVVLDLPENEVPMAESVAVVDEESFDTVEGESHVTPMGEPYRSSLVGETAPSIEHSQEHIGSAMPEGTVAPPPPGATVKAGARVAVRRVHVGNAALPKLKLKRGQTALRSAIVLREVLSRPRAYDI